MSYLDRNNQDFVKAKSLCKCFLVGGNSSCHMHIHQRFDIYQKCCTEAKIKPHHWAIPQNLWNKMVAEKAGTSQTMLNKLFVKLEVVKEFTKENLLQAVTKFIAIDDQVSCPTPCLLMDLTSLNSLLLSLIMRPSKIALLPCAQRP